MVRGRSRRAQRGGVSGRWVLALACVVWGHARGQGGAAAPPQETLESMVDAHMEALDRRAAAFWQQGLPGEAVERVVADEPARAASLSITVLQASIQLAQPMHSICRPWRISIPVGQTCTQRLHACRQWIDQRVESRGGCQQWTVPVNHYWGRAESLQQGAGCTFKCMAVQEPGRRGGAPSAVSSPLHGKHTLVRLKQ